MSEPNIKGAWFVDKETICSNMCISKTYFEENFMKDARIKSCEYRKGRKILWETEKVKKYMKQIMSEIAE
ncbi:hypothetical protein [Salinicoccus roseus]|uniref:Uncharacterized protein n=1 Tax=Salinicoccus roseus TaxID=45670 RepID=A0A0C2H889_9STAP|nr:hypothetical protein [Salinicoccus roseus]KIH70045.1 hypothetical protein SN16_11120 [Salinicoccus roseus]MDB0581352.1 hypothetical protein [Salinicoccus roseus]